MTVVRVRISDDLFKIIRDLPVSEVMRSALYLYLSFLNQNHKTDRLIGEIVKGIELQIEKLNNEKRMHELRIAEIDLEIKKCNELLKMLKEKDKELEEYLRLIRERIVNAFTDVTQNRIKKEQLMNRVRILSRELCIPEMFILKIVYEEFGEMVSYEELS